MHRITSYCAIVLDDYSDETIDNLDIIIIAGITSYTDMSSAENPNEANGAGLERCVSYGRGGAGNLRRPSDVHDTMRAEDQDGQRRRRSSALSTSSSNGEGRRASIVKAATSIFRKGSTESGEELVAKQEE
ncbi:MAG: hypothetical protein M1830_003175 [Pleopsidium flavum]|nr:MAG: hypothetical protein M1830_003175 [Pleopsidium flavum]